MFGKAQDIMMEKFAAKMLTKENVEKIAKGHLPGILNNISKSLTEKYKSELREGETTVSFMVCTKPGTGKSYILFMACNNSFTQQRTITYKTLDQVIDEADEETVKSLLA